MTSKVAVTVAIAGIFIAIEITEIAVSVSIAMALIHISVVHLRHPFVPKTVFYFGVRGAGKAA